MASSVSNILSLISSKILSGGRRTTALNTREVLNEVADSYYNKVDSPALENIVENGDGTKYLSDDGTYKTVSGGGVGGTWGSITGDLEDQTDLQTALDAKVDKVTGKGLSTEDYTTTEKSKLASITEIFTTSLKTAYDSAVTWISTNGTNILNHISSNSNPHSVTKAQVGLGNVPNLDTSTTANITDSTNKRFVTDAQLTVIGNTSGTNSGNETTTTIGTLVNGATSKTTPVDADQVPLMDSAASNVIKKLSWANVKATLKSYFDTLYLASSGGTLTGLLTFAGSTSSRAVFNIPDGTQKTTSLSTGDVDCDGTNIRRRFTGGVWKTFLFDLANSAFTGTGTRAIVSDASGNLSTTPLSSLVSGQATLVSGVVAVTISGLTSSSIAFVTLATPGGTLAARFKAVCTTNTLTITAIDTTGATVTSETSTYNYLVQV